METATAHRWQRELVWGLIANPVPGRHEASRDTSRASHQHQPDGWQALRNLLQRNDLHILWRTDSGLKSNSGFAMCTGNFSIR
jgi:hypothetical protein